MHMKCQKHIPKQVTTHHFFTVFSTNIIYYNKSKYRLRI